VITAREATRDDAAELVRLRSVMLSALSDGPPARGPWQDTAVRFLRTHLGDGDRSLTAFVVDHPDRAGSLAACAVGSIEHRLPSPENPRGVTGYVFSVATEPDQRRRGYARACLVALLDWYRQRDVTRVDLRASPEGEPLYASLGFIRTPDPAMRLRLDVVGLRT
jgi:GNAT superfamily N-acetyltransferase